MYIIILRDLNRKLKLVREMREFCTINNIFFNPSLFDFLTLNEYQGPVPIPSSTDPTDDEENFNPCSSNTENTNNNVPILTDPNL